MLDRSTAGWQSPATVGGCRRVFQMLQQGALGGMLVLEVPCRTSECESVRCKAHAAAVAVDDVGSIPTQVVRPRPESTASTPQVENFIFVCLHWWYIPNYRTKINVRYQLLIGVIGVWNGARKCHGEN